MNDTLDFLNKLNWLLKPISNLVIFLFTTGTGITILIAGFLGIIFLSVYNALKERDLAYMAAKPGESRGAPFHDKIFITSRAIAKVLLKMISNIPVFLAVFIFLIMITGLSKTIDSVGDFFLKQQRIKELQSVLKQLDQRYKVAEVEVADYNQLLDETELNIRFYDYALLGLSDQVQTVKIKGQDIYFDAVVLNFEYSEITTGNEKNLVIPYRIFSDKIPQEMGVPLNIADMNGIPFIFKRNDTDIYGMERNTYSQRVKEIMGYITDKNKAREAGIRSVYGNAVHKVVNKGDVLNIWIEQTGGLVIKESTGF
ncbi:MAG: hypothetical protein U0W24_04020 [Bacteroidales bacterium]